MSYAGVRKGSLSLSCCSAGHKRFRSPRRRELFRARVEISGCSTALTLMSLVQKRNCSVSRNEIAAKADFAGPASAKAGLEVLELMEDLSALAGVGHGKKLGSTIFRLPHFYAILRSAISQSCARRGSEKMSESGVGTNVAQSAEGNVTPPWLIELKDKAARGKRPLDKAHGRWLGDFLDQATASGLLPTELLLLDACARGDPCEPFVQKESFERAKGLTWDTGKAEALKDAVPSNRVRAAFLRFLALGGDESAPVHEAGVELHRAFVDGKIDLRGAKCVGRLNLETCYLDGLLVIEDASLGNLILQESRVTGIKAERAKLSGSVILEKSFVDGGEINFIGAEIGGSLSCGASKIRPKKGLDGLICTGAKIGGDVDLTAGFDSTARVLFNRARIGGNFDCSGGKFTEPNGVALDCQASNIAGCVYLMRDTSAPANPAFEADGEVKFTGASIGLQFACQGGRFRNGNTDHKNCARTALDLGSATIKDTLFLGVEEGKRQEPAMVEGRVNLTGAYVRVLIDDEFVGGGEKGKGDDGKQRHCHLVLDNFTYDRLAGDAACKSSVRQAWLERQPPEHLERQFRPQPFEQNVKVLRAMGHNKDADEIALEKRWRVWKAKPWWDWKAIPRWAWRFFYVILIVIFIMSVTYSLWLLDGNPVIFISASEAVIFVIALSCIIVVSIMAKLFELVFLYWFLGYGYRISRALFILVIFGIVFGWFYQQAYVQGAIIPSDKELRASECKTDSGYHKPLWLVPFKAWLYSADVIIPVVELGQKKAWQPAYNVPINLPILGHVESPNLVYYVQLTETALGWMGSLLLVSFVSGLIKKE